MNSMGHYLDHVGLTAGRSRRKRKSYGLAWSLAILAVVVALALL